MKMGILIVNKDKGFTSHDVVSILRKKLNFKKIGHTGTLDPMATGVLPICISNATRISEYIMNQGKSYVAEFRFGELRDTYDITGEVIKTSENINFSKEEIREVLNNFMGEIDQIPPIYSAIKVDGKKLYQYARENKDVKITSRKVKIYRLELLDYSNGIVKIEVECSKGTYIRSLIHDIGIKLNSYATMTSLVRTRVGNFKLEDSINIDNIQKMTSYDLQKNFVDIEDALFNLPKITIKDELFDRLRNGQRININSIEDINGDIVQYKDICVIVQGIFLGIGKIKEDILKMEKVLWQE